MIQSAYAGMARRWLAAAAGLLYVGAALPAGAQSVDPFLVENVRVDVTAESATEARNQAHAEGQRIAFDRLLRRLTQPANAANLPQLDDARLTQLVEGIQIRSERTSGVRYIAELDYRFKSDAVRNLLRGHGVNFVESTSRPVLVLPVFRTQGGDRLWEDPNPWREAWIGVAPQGGLVPIVLPLGDLSDFRAIDAQRAVNGDTAALSQIAERYDAGEVLVAIAETRQSGSAPVTVSVNSYNALTQSVSLMGTFFGRQGTTADDGFRYTARSITEEVENRWRSSNVVSFGPEATLDVVAPLTGFEYWINLRDRLRSVSTVSESRVTSLKRNEARLQLVYVGTVERLQLALAQNDLVLSREGPAATSTEPEATPPPADGAAGDNRAVATPLAPPQSSVNAIWTLRLSGFRAAAKPE